MKLINNALLRHRWLLSIFTGICLMTSKLAVAQSTKKASKNSLDFVHALWKAKLDPFEDDYFDPYYDGLLYVFNLMHLSAKYQMITSQGK